MKTKLEMAHDYLRDIVSNWEYDDSFDPVAEAWQYADAMQAEADKRENEDQEKLKQDDRNHHDALVEIGLEEWQPDWSQAPRCDVVSWDINEHGQARWIASDNGYYLAPSFGYTGDWRESLRKRPK